MLYDAERTRDVVNRLVLLGNRLQAVTVVINAIQYGALLGNRLQAVTVVINAIQYGALLGILGVLAAGPTGLVVFALVGIVAGVFIGMFIARALSTGIEWMAQMLISQQPRQ